MMVKCRGRTEDYGGGYIGFGGRRLISEGEIHTKENKTAYAANTYGSTNF